MDGPATRAGEEDNASPPARNLPTPTHHLRPRPPTGAPVTHLRRTSPIRLANRTHTSGILGGPQVALQPFMALGIHPKQLVSVTCHAGSMGGRG